MVSPSITNIHSTIYFHNNKVVNGTYWNMVNQYISHCTRLSAGNYVNRITDKVTYTRQTHNFKKIAMNCIVNTAKLCHTQILKHYWYRYYWLNWKTYPQWHHLCSKCPHLARLCLIYRPHTRTVGVLLPLCSILLTFVFRQCKCAKLLMQTVWCEYLLWVHNNPQIKMN